MKENKHLPLYEDIINVLQCQQRPMIPAELHGYLCGVIAGKKHAEDKAGAQIVFDILEEEGLATAVNRKLLAKLMVMTFQQLQDSDYTFELLLPCDDGPIDVRCQALGSWCQSFLTGLGFVGLDAKDIEQKEILHDIAEIAKVNCSTSEDKEAGEQAYVELVEYVRMVVIMIYTENVGERIPKQSTVH